MPRIIPIKELKDTTKISELCQSTDTPIYITKNGYGNMVIMSMDTYEKTLKKHFLGEDFSLSKKKNDR